MDVKLSNMKVGQCGVVKDIVGEGPVRRRLMDMGITPGAAVEVIGVAPLGDPVQIIVRGYRLSIRKSEADKIYVENISQAAIA